MWWLTLAVVLLLGPSSAAAAAADSAGDERTQAPAVRVTSPFSEPRVATSAAIAKVASRQGVCQRLSRLIRDTKVRIGEIRRLLSTATGAAETRLRKELKLQKRILREARAKKRRLC